MKLRVVLLGDTQHQEWLRATLGAETEIQLVEAGRADELVAQIGRIGNVQAVFVHFDSAHQAERSAIVERLTEISGDLPVLALGNGLDTEVMLGAMRAGARDFLVPGRDDPGVPALIERAMRRSAPRAPNRNRVTTILSAYADTGVAFLAEHLAIVGTETLPHNEPVLLLDLSLPAGAGLIFLNMAQEYSVLDAIQDAYRCDQTLVDTAFTRHSSGAYVLSLPEPKDGVSPPDPDDLGRFVDVVRGLFSWVIIAIDASFGPQSLRAVVERSTQTLLVTEQSIINSRANQQLLRRLRQTGCPLERTGLVVDRYQRKLDLAPEKLAEPLQLPLVATLGGDGLTRIQAMNAGESLFQIAPRDDYVHAVRQLAQQLLERRMSRVEPAQGGLLGRLLR